MAALTIVHTETHDETKPAGTRAKSLGDDDIREFKRTVRERLAIDHAFYDDESGHTDVGAHKKITLAEIQGSDPSTYDNVGYLYLKDVSAVVELFWKDESGNVVQLTSGGKIKASSIEDVTLSKTGDWMISSVTTARTGWTNVSATYSNKFMRINATPLTTGGSDTDSITLTTTELPAHTHTVTARGAYGAGSIEMASGCGGPTDGNITTSSAGSGSAFTVDTVPAYVQVVVFQKD